MANNFAISIIGIDKFSNVFRKLNESASRAVRPAAIAQRQFATLGKELHFDKIGKGLRVVSSSTLDIAESLGLASVGMRAVFGLGALGGVVATAAAVGKLSSRWGNLGFEVNKTANATGYSTDTLQKYVGAAKLAGVSSEAITGSLAGVAKTMQDIRGGRNPDADKMLHLLGINENENNEKVLLRLSDALSKIANPQLRQMLAETFGLDIGSLPLLSKGSAAVANLQQQAKQLGLVMTPQQIKEANDYALAMFQVDAAFTGLANTLGSKFGPSIARGLNWINDLIRGGGPSGAAPPSNGTRPAGGVVSNLTDLVTGKINGQAFWNNVDASTRTPLGLRNNNPGNLRSWGGVPTVGGFAQFRSSQEGLNAMAKQLSLYQNRDGLNTVSGILGKYAPRSENDTGAYVADVSKALNVGPGQAIDVNDPKVMAPLMSAMIRHENGQQPFSADQINQAAQTTVHVQIANAPPGSRATVTSSGPGVPAARVSYCLPHGSMP